MEKRALMYRKALEDICSYFKKQRDSWDREEQDAETELKQSVGILQGGSVAVMYEGEQMNYTYEVSGSSLQTRVQIMTISENSSQVFKGSELVAVYKDLFKSKQHKLF